MQPQVNNSDWVNPHDKHRQPKYLHPFVNIKDTSLNKPINKSPSHITALCIPRIDANISKDYIYKILASLKIGKICHLIEIPLRHDNTNKRIIIKMIWNNTQLATRLQTQLISLGSIKLVHDDPWYWKILPANPQK